VTIQLDGRDQEDLARRSTSSRGGRGFQKRRANTLRPSLRSAFRGEADIDQWEKMAGSVENDPTPTWGGQLPGA
jgi:hypothetical protein